MKSNNTLLITKILATGEIQCITLQLCIEKLKKALAYILTIE